MQCEKRDIEVLPVDIRQMSRDRVMNPYVVPSCAQGMSDGGTTFKADFAFSRRSAGQHHNSQRSSRQGILHACILAMTSRKSIPTGTAAPDFQGGSQC